jgi:hypothetical protein
MALPTRQNWRAAHQPEYVGAAVWGSGINPVHGQYGGPPLRVEGRNEQTPKVQPVDQSMDQTSQGELWGYTPEDWSYLNPAPLEHWVLRDQWNPGDFGIAPSFPAATVNTPERRRNVTAGFPSWGQRSWAGLAWFRAQFMGEHRYPVDPTWPRGAELVRSLPSETVSEGWENKARGKVADAKPSSPDQYEMQTSMQQRYRSRNNQHAVARSTDDPRTDISSRIAGQKLKVYSGQQRHYDMFPFQQDEIIRPFWYRTAGTGEYTDMIPNEQMERTPIMRVPPMDPSIGIPASAPTGSDYGYTQEDQFYA